MKDIETREDIFRLLEQFYMKAIPDAIIGYFFTSVVKLDLTTHLPVITDFWEMVILNGNRYKKNAIAIHAGMHRLSAMKDEHFDRWIKLFTETVDEMFVGEKAELAKQRAVSIATVMKIKIVHASPLNNIQ